MAEFLELVMPIVDENNQATPYFEDYLFQIIQEFGGEGESPIPGLISNTSRKADTLLFAVLDKVSLGDPLTADTTGFTADNTNFTADMTES